MNKMTEPKKRRKGIIPPQEQFIKPLDPNQGTPVEIERLDEKWSECHLKNGTVLRIRPIIVEVRDHGIDANGNPRYGIKSSIMVDTQMHPTKKK